jgi:hypothetical protein
MRGAQALEHRNVAAKCQEQTVKKLLIAVFVAGAVPALAGSPREHASPERHHRNEAIDRANDRQRAAEAKVIEAKIMEKTKINQH